MTAPSKGAAFAGMLFCVVAWGTQFALSQSILQTIDQFWFAVLRYVPGALLFSATLYWREGVRGFALEGRAPELVCLGVCGFTSFGIIVFWSLYYTSPAHATIILAMQPMLIAFWLWVARGVRPPLHTLICILAAFAGLFLVITRGDFAHALSGGSLIGDAMALFGAISWIVYTLGAARFGGFSPLRYTTLTCLMGTLAIIALTAALTPLGIARTPTPQALAANLPAIAYISIFPLYAAVFFFARAVARLGALNTLLIANGTPLVVFFIEALLGRAPLPVEWAGAALVLAALVANNLLDRRQAKLDRPTA